WIERHDSRPAIHLMSPHPEGIAGPLEPPDGFAGAIRLEDALVNVHPSRLVKKSTFDAILLSRLVNWSIASMDFRSLNTFRNKETRWNHPVQWLRASTAKAVAASDMNLPEWLAGSRFFTTDTLRHGPVAA